MCFGNQQTDQKTTTSTANPAVQGAATGNLDYVSQLMKAGFQPYQGQQVANFSPLQNASFNMGAGVAGNGTGQAAQDLIGSYATAPASSVGVNSIASGMSPYMNQYVMQALAPQLQQMDMSNAQTNANTNALAAGSGAFGDARTGIEQANNAFNQNTQREGVIGNAYNSAFNTAIGASAQDQSNSLTAQTTNASLMEQALSRQLGGANALEGLQNQQMGIAGAVNQFGQQQTAQDQAGLTANYNQWLMGQQYPFQLAQLMNQTVQAGSQAMPATQQTTDVQPNNSGWGMLGSILGGVGKGLGSAGIGALLPLMFSDEDLKEDIVQVGEMKDGTPIYTYRYFDDPENVTRIGLMAQDVEKRVPEAVKELWPGGAKMVDYRAATALSRALALEEAA